MEKSVALMEEQSAKVGANGVFIDSLGNIQFSVIRRDDYPLIATRQV